MRILVLCGNERIAREQLNHAAHDVTRRLPQITLEKEGSSVMFFPLRLKADTIRLSGLQFDVVIEHESFNYERCFEKAAMVNIIKAMVLR